LEKIYLNKNVLEAAEERLRYIFTNFDNVYFSFSGGKDSSVMLQLANKIADEMNYQFDVLYIDLEGNYKSTRKHVKELKESLEAIRDFYWVCLPIKLRNAVSQTHSHWICWDEAFANKWIRQRPKDSINIKNIKTYGWDSWFVEKMQFEDFIISFANWYQNTKSGPVAAGIGIRSTESLNRYRTILNTRKGRYNNLSWTTEVKALQNVYNFYPIYDWETKDIWIATFKLDFKYNEFYDVMYKAGYSIHNTRLCQPYGDDQRQGLDQFKFFEPETWGKVLMRVNGVNFGNIYAKTIATGTGKPYKPDNLSWEEFSIFLLETIGSVNIELMLHYKEKIKKFIEWHEKNGNTIFDEADSKLESSKQVASWRRVGKMLMKNDYYGKSLSFSQTKKDDEKLNKLLDKWSELL